MVMPIIDLMVINLKEILLVLLNKRSLYLALFVTLSPLCLLSS